jgi:FtsP/CotA-like multicopper oxidase with cupredoxin domain
MTWSRPEISPTWPGRWSSSVASASWSCCCAGPSALVERRPKTGSPGEYGLLAAVAAPSTMIEGEQLRLRLAASGIRANLVTTTEGPRLMVFDRDLGVARAVLKNPPPANGPGKLSP